MRMDINNLTKFRINKEFFSTVAKIVLKGENRVTETLSLAFVNKAEIKKLNKNFRKKNKATDVLSFDLEEDGYLGEIIICPEVVKNYGENFETELIKVFIHGILHLLKYDHEKNRTQAKLMQGKEKFYLAKIYGKR